MRCEVDGLGATPLDVPGRFGSSLGLVFGVVFRLLFAVEPCLAVAGAPFRAPEAAFGFLMGLTGDVFSHAAVEPFR
jgi:hypothetical protein